MVDASAQIGGSDEEGDLIGDVETEKCDVKVSVVGAQRAAADGPEVVERVDHQQRAHHHNQPDCYHYRDVAEVPPNYLKLTKVDSKNFVGFR